MAGPSAPTTPWRLRVAGWAIDLAAGRAKAAAVERANRNGGTIAEIGTGVGEALAGYAAGTEVVCIDRDAQAMRIAEARRTRRSLAHVAGFACADFARLPVASNRCDAAVVLFRLFEMEDPAAALAEIGRIVRPGGEIVIVDYLAHGAGWRAGLDRALGRFGAVLGGGRAGDVAGLVDASGMTLTAVRRVAPAGLFTIVCLRAEDAAQAGAEASGGTDQADRRRPARPARTRRRARADGGVARRHGRRSRRFA